MTNQLAAIIKPHLRSRLHSRNIPDFLPGLDRNKKTQAKIWDSKTFLVDPHKYVLPTIQDRFAGRLMRGLSLPKSPVIVDIGCFIGEKLWQFSDRPGRLAVGVDIARDSLQTAKKIDKSGHYFLAADMEHLPFRDKSVDLVMAFDVIEHLSSAEKGIAEVARILKPGGYFLLHTPKKDNRFSLFWLKQKIFPRQALQDYAEVGHTPDRLLTSAQVKMYLDQFGMSTVREIHFNSFFTHLFDRELNSFVAWFMSLRPRPASSKPSATSSVPVSPLRQIYFSRVLPVLELFSTFDRIPSVFRIGNTYFNLSCKRLTSQYYRKNTQYSDFLDGSSEQDSRLYTGTALEFLKKKEKFLDVGCGTGTAVNYLSGKGITAWGIEVSDSSLRLARRKKGKFVNFDGKRLPFPDNSFQGVGSWNVLEHVSDPCAFLDEKLRVLKPGGFLFVGTPNFLSLTNSYHPRLTGWRNRILNIYLLLSKIFTLLIRTQVKFSHIQPVIDRPFFPDADAINLTNFPDLLNWAKLRRLQVMISSGSLVPRPGWQNWILCHTPIKFITGGVFVVLRKPKTL